MVSLGGSVALRMSSRSISCLMRENSKEVGPGAEQENRGIAHLAIISSRGAELMYQNKETFKALSEASRIRGLGKKNNNNLHSEFQVASDSLEAMC